MTNVLMIFAISAIFSVPLQTSAGEQPPAKGSSKSASAIPRGAGQWIWPLDQSQYGKDKITQDYGQWEGLGSNNSHHTGLDIGTSGNTPVVMAVASGYVAKLSPNDDRGSSCKNDSVPCSDHGLGNTLILQHSGRNAFSQFSHLSSFDSSLQSAVERNCSEFKGYDANGVYVHEWKCPNGAVPVSVGNPIGTVGGSGYGSPDAWQKHLHFEAKHVAMIYSKDPSDPNDGFSFGYSAAFPDHLDYVDPVHYLERRKTEHPPLLVMITDAGNGVNLRLGPSSKYTAALAGKSHNSYYAFKYTGATTDCPLGWYKIARTSVWPPDDQGTPQNTYFQPTTQQLLPGLVAATWVCRGLNANDPWVSP